MSYINPIPSLDDETVSKKFMIEFKFEDYCTREEALKGINNLLNENGGKVELSWLHMTGNIKTRLVSPEQKGRII